MSISRLIQMGTAGVSAGGGGVVWTDPDIANLSYDSVSFDLSIAANLRGMVFKPDGTKLFLSQDSTDSIKEYTMSTAWDISTLSNTSNFSVFSQVTSNQQGIFFKPDGYAFYLVDLSGSRVLEYSLSTAWDLSTASYSSNTFSTTGENNPTSVYFKPDGTKMYVTGYGSDNVIEYSLSTAWDITTGSSQATFSVASQTSFPAQISFNPTGTKMYLTMYSVVIAGDIFEYDLSTAWDISSASYNSVSYGDATLTNPVTHAFKSDGSKAYFIDDTDIIYQYTAPAAVASSWTDPDIANASYDSVSFSVSTEENATRGMAFKTDGTKMYITGETGDDVNEYNLSTAWDLSSASYNQLFSVAAQEGLPQSLFFKDDGTKMYVLGRGQDEVDEYNLSTAWDVSTGSYSQNFSVATQDTDPRGLFFKHDGTKMYVSGWLNDSVYEYNLSTSWDVSTASYSQSFSTATQDQQPYDLNFNDDGTKMYIIGTQNEKVFEYDLSTGWDVSTASYNSISFSVAIQSTSAQSFRFKSDGSKMYMVGQGNVYQYST